MPYNAVLVTRGHRYLAFADDGVPGGKGDRSTTKQASKEQRAAAFNVRSLRSFEEGRGWRRRHERRYGVLVEGFGRILPERIESDRVLLRRWRVGDAEELSRAIAESQDHLRPWMDFMASEPQTLEQRRTMLVQWEREWRNGGDVLLGIFVDDEVAGGCGLHRRAGPSGLEIGYWVHASYVGQGIGTAVARLLTDAAFAVPGITHVEIHTHKANAASSAIARRLGFRFLGEIPDGTDRPVRCAWRMDRAASPRP